MKDLSIAEIVVIVALCVVPVVMGLVLVMVAVCQKSGLSDVLSGSSEGDERDFDVGPKSDQVYPAEIETETDLESAKGDRPRHPQ